MASGRKGDPLQQARDLTLRLQSLRTEVEDLGRVLGSKTDTASRRSRARARIQAGDELVLALETSLQVLRSGVSAIAAGAVGDFEKEVRAFQAAKVAYSRDSERAGPPRPDGSVAAEGGGDGGGRRDGGDEESGSRVQRQEFARKLRDGRVDLAYELAEERKEATSAIHREAVSVREAAQDLANLVNDQDEGITAIESQVTEAKDAVVEGNNDLETTIEYQKALRKKWCFCLIIGVLILLAICIPVLLHLTKSS